MKITFRFPSQYDRREVEYESPSVPPVDTVIFANNKINYKVVEIRWEVDVDSKICQPVVILKDTGEQPSAE